LKMSVSQHVRASLEDAGGGGGLCLGFPSFHPPEGSTDLGLSPFQDIVLSHFGGWLRVKASIKQVQLVW